MKRTYLQRSRSPMNKIGKRGLANLELRTGMHEKAKLEGWHDHCELIEIFKDRGMNVSPCFGPLQFCHARKRHARSKWAQVGSPEHEMTVCRGCSFHHQSRLDLLAPSLTMDIVMEAIRRRTVDKPMTAEEVKAAIASRRHITRPEAKPPCACSHPYHKGKECLVAVRGMYCQCERYEPKE
jgi:hypothetical protein